MNREELKKTERNEEVRKPIKPELKPEVSEVEKGKNNIQEKDSTQEETSEKIREDELKEIEDPNSKWKWVIGVSIIAIITILLLVALTVFILPKKEKVPEKATNQQVQEVTTREVVEDATAQEQVEEKVVIEEADETTIEEVVEGENVVKEVEIEESTIEDTVVEMVDWDTWATQPDNDEICVVVWNEENHVQKIIENEEKYIVQKGDKLAVPRRENVMKVCVNGESKSYDSGSYIDIVIDSNELVTINLIYKNDKGEYEINNYYLQKSE